MRKAWSQLVHQRAVLRVVQRRQAGYPPVNEWAVLEYPANRANDDEAVAANFSYPREDFLLASFANQFGWVMEWKAGV